MADNTKTPCPCCDVEELGMPPIMALGLGVMLGASFRDVHDVTKLMCATHRVVYIATLAKCAVLSNSFSREDRGA